MEYSYDAEDRLLSDGKDDFSYDANGNMTGVKSGEDTVEYVYNTANKLIEVKYPDGTYVKYGYDAFGRKVSREEAYWNKEEGDAPGKSEYAPGQNKEKSNSGNGKGNPNGSANGNAKGKAEKKNPLKLKTDTTSYLYDGFTNVVTNEYTGNGSPLGQYYMANDRVVSKKTFGNHGLVIPGREPSLKTNGGLMDYHYDGMRNVTELTDRNGDSIEQYRYDAFGGLYTGITAPYNTNSFAGKNYDPKANLIDNNARWYQAQTGRFTSADPYRGDMLTPYTQNRYAYVGNNPINRWDPLGYADAGDGDGGSRDTYFAFYDADWILLSEWTDIDYDSTKTKLSNGWRVNWERTTTENKKYRVDVFSVWFYVDGTYGDIADYDFEYTKQEILSKVTEESGSRFDPFTAHEWFEENKTELKKYKKPESTIIALFYEPASAYSKTNAKQVYFSATTQTGTKLIVESTRNDKKDFESLQQKIIQDELKNKEGKAAPYGFNYDGSNKGTGKPAGGNQILNGVKDVAGQFLNSLGIVVSAPGNILRNISMDLGSGNFSNIPSGIWGGITGERQTTVLDLAMTKDGQAKFQQSHPNLYQIASVTTSFIDPMAIIPGGKAASAGNELKAGFTVFETKGPVIIGETMKRVEMEAAKYPGAKILNDMPEYMNMGLTDYEVTIKMMEYNRKWILEQLRSGREIIDIGIDASRKIPSIFYQMEQNMIKNYNKLNP